MARVLAISSHVAYGSVGLAVTVPALQALGHEVIAVPTIVLSNHPGYQTFAGDAVPPASLERMIAALGANGWLEGVDAVLTGYLPTAEHVGVAERAILSTRAQSASALVVVDPVLGDDPGGVYIPEAAAIAIRDRLLRHARLLTPNRFELAWLSGLPVGGTDEAAAAALALPAPEVLATSIPAGTGRLATILTASPRHGPGRGAPAVAARRAARAPRAPRVRRGGPRSTRAGARAPPARRWARRTARRSSPARRR